MTDKCYQWLLFFLLSKQNNKKVFKIGERHFSQRKESLELDGRQLHLETTKQYEQVSATFSLSSWDIFFPWHFRYHILGSYYYITTH